jgi:DNA-binding beta-propeller fold protein YncE
MLAAVAASAAPPPRTAKVLSARWLASERLQASGLAVVGAEVYVIGDRAAKRPHTVHVYSRRALYGGRSPLEPVRVLELKVDQPDIKDAIKRRFYEERVCQGSDCVLDIEDMAVDGSGAIYVAVEGRADAVIKFDAKTLRAVDLWPEVTGDQANLGAEGLAVSRDGRTVIVGRQAPAELIIIDTRTHWISRGPVDVDEIGGLAYDGLRRSLYVLDKQRNEVCRVGFDGTVLSRHGLGPRLEYDPDGRRYKGMELGAIAFDRDGNLLAVSDPKHGDDKPYRPTDGEALPLPYEGGYSILYRIRLGR